MKRLEIATKPPRTYSVILVVEAKTINIEAATLIQMAQCLFKHDAL